MAQLLTDSICCSHSRLLHGSMAPAQQPHLQLQPRRGMRKADLVAVAAVSAGHLGAPRLVQHARILLHEQGGVDVVAI